MRIKIVSDGTSWGTTVCNAETGETIEGFTKIRWCIKAKGVAVAELTLEGVVSELIADIDPYSGDENATR